MRLVQNPEGEALGVPYTFRLRCRGSNAYKSFTSDRQLWALSRPATVWLCLHVFELKVYAYPGVFMPVPRPSTVDRHHTKARTAVTVEKLYYGIYRAHVPSFSCDILLCTGKFVLCLLACAICHSCTVKLKCNGIEMYSQYNKSKPFITIMTHLSAHTLTDIYFVK